MDATLMPLPDLTDEQVMGLAPLPEQKTFSDDEVMGLKPLTGQAIAGHVPVGADEADFQKAYSDIVKKRADMGMPLGANPDDPAHKYDARAAFRAGDLKIDESGHFSSKYKDLDHPRRFLPINGVMTDTATGEPAPDTYRSQGPQSEAFPVNKPGITPFDVALTKFPQQVQDAAKAQQSVMDQPTMKERGVEAIGQFGRGATNAIAKLPEGMAIAAKAIDNAMPKAMQVYSGKDARELSLGKLAKAMEDIADDFLPLRDPRQANYFTSKLASGAGTIAGMAGPEGIANAIGRAPKLLQMLFAGMGAADQYEQAKAGGADENTALSAAGLGGLTNTAGASMIHSIMGAFSAVPASMKEAVTQALKETAISGAGLNAGLQLSHNIIAKLYDPNRPIMQGVGEAAGIGAALVGPLQLGARVLRGKMLGDWAQQNPDKAAKLAAIKQPSRTDFVEAGLPKAPADERAETAQILRNTPTEPPAQAPTVEPAAPIGASHGQEVQAQEKGQGEAQKQDALAQTVNPAEVAAGAATPEKPPAKEPWQMTKEEFLRGVIVPPEKVYYEIIDKATREGKLKPPVDLEALAATVKRKTGLNPRVIQDRVKQLGTPEAVAETFPGDHPVAVYARALADGLRTNIGTEGGATGPEDISVSGSDQSSQSAPGTFPNSSPASGVEETGTGGSPAEVAPQLTGAEKLRASLQQAADEALKRIADKESTLRAGLDPELLKDYAVVGAHMIVEGAINVAEFTKRIVAKFGEAVAEHVPAIWQAANAKLAEMGRPDLAQYGKTEEARRVEQIADVKRNIAGENDVRHRTVPMDEATARLAGRPAEERTKALNEAPVTEADWYAANTIFNNEAADVNLSGDKLVEAVKIKSNLRAGKQEAARMLGVRGEIPANSEAARAAVVKDELYSLPDAQQAKVDAAETKATEAEKRGDTNGAEASRAEADRIRTLWAQNITQIKQKMALVGLDLQKLMNGQYDRATTIKAMDKFVRPEKATLVQKILWYRINALLSGTATAKKAISDPLNIVRRQVLNRAFEAAINLVANKPDAATFGEFKKIGRVLGQPNAALDASGSGPRWMKAILPGLGRAAAVAYDSFDLGRSEFSQRMRGEGTDAWDLAGPPIGGKAGRVIGTPGRALTGTDQFYTSIAAELEAGMQAHRIAKAQGLTGDAYEKFVGDQVADLNSDAWKKAVDQADLSTFKGPMGALGVALNKIRKMHPAIESQVPFFKILWNATRQGLTDFTPIGTVKLGAALARGEPASTTIPLAANQLLAWGTLAALIYKNDDHDPFITGPTPRTAARSGLDRSEAQAPANSIKIGGRWLSYNSVEPFATGLSALVALSEAVKGTKKTGNVEYGVKRGMEGIITQITDKSFVKSLADIYELAEKQDLEAAGKWASNFATSFYPRGFARIAASANTDQPDRRVRGEGVDWIKSLGNRAAQKTELPQLYGALQDYPMRDLFGRPQPSGTAPLISAPATDAMWRIASPILSREQMSRAPDRVIANWNADHPDKAYTPDPPSNKITMKKGQKPRVMTDPEYDRFAELAGQTAFKIAEPGVGDPAHPTEADIATVHEAVNHGRNVAIKALAKEWSGGDKAPSADELADAYTHDSTITAIKHLASSPPKIGAKDYEDRMTTYNKSIATAKTRLRNTPPEKLDALFNEYMSHPHSETDQQIDARDTHRRNFSRNMGGR